MERSSNSNARLFTGVVLAVVTLDIVTKFLAVFHLPPRVPHEVLGQEWMRLTLVYNRGAAFGLHLGHDVVTRIVFSVLTMVALIILWRLLAQTRVGDSLRVFAISLVTAGAVGNLVDRIRSDRGVVDFLDFGIGVSRWPTFNVADMAVSTGAVLLAVVLWREESHQRRESSSTAQPGTSLPQGSGETVI